MKTSPPGRTFVGRIPRRRLVLGLIGFLGLAALIANSLPDRPIRLQWMREQEHGWEPYGPAMVAKVRASLNTSGRIVDWDCGVWSNTHTTRPGPAGALLAARHIERSFPAPEPTPLPQPEGGGDRNAIPLYALPNARVVHHFLPDMPVRVSALRSLGAQMNVFAIESFVDELALAAGADPVEFRLKQLDDPRARDAGKRAWIRLRTRAPQEYRRVSRDCHGGRGRPGNGSHTDRACSSRGRHRASRQS